MNQMSDVSVEQLRRAVQIKEEIEALESQLGRLLGGNGASRGRPVGRPAAGRRRMSAAGRARIAAALRARWARARSGTGSSTRKRRTMSPAARAKIAAAQRARWAKVRARK